ncbi:MAG: CvpA family protein [Alphaproteobacteria bacterium]|nr:CvpA family protein [Alphaproteobacteria bacterium]
MSFQILDFVLFGIMLFSGVLALARGFTREVLSLVAWGAGAVAAYFAIKQQKLLDLFMPYAGKPIIAAIAVGAMAFIIVMIVVSVIGVKISDRVVDSRVGAFDRSLGFIYGMARGLVFVAIAYLFYGWLTPSDRQEDWVRKAQTLPVISSVGDMLLRFVPPDIAATLSKSAQIGNPQGPVTTTPAPPADQGTAVTPGQAKGLDNLIQGTTGNAAKTEPTFGQSTTQQ